jgi:hypothetical protein
MLTQKNSSAPLLRQATEGEVQIKRVRASLRSREEGETGCDKESHLKISGKYKR